MNVFDNVTGTAHVVAESSLLKATTTGHIYSLKMDKARDNGTICSVGTWVEAQVFNAKDFVAGEHPILILTPPLGYNADRREYQDEKYFYNAKDEIARGYELHDGDIFTVTENAFSGSPAVGKYVDAALTIAEEAGSTGFVGEIVEKVVHTNSTSYRVLVRKTGV